MGMQKSPLKSKGLRNQKVTNTNNAFRIRTISQRNSSMELIRYHNSNLIFSR